MTTLGEREWQTGWRVRHVPRSAIHLAKMAGDIIDLVGMTIDDDPDIRHYPTGEGNGGHGIQLYQPLV